MLYRIIVLVVAVLIWLALHLTGHDSHRADGIIFFGLIAVETLLILVEGRKKPHS